MNLLSVENISKSYSEKILLDDISLGISEGDRIGIIGVNGTGKSTLLKIITGNETPDKGRIITANNVHMEYLPQNPLMDSEAAVLKQVFKGDSRLMILLREYESALDMINMNPEDSKLQKSLMALNSKMDAEGGWAAESEAKAILTKLGIYDFRAKVGTLSGGQKKRVALASILISPSDILILDEPTNHLDNETIEWLEEYLMKRSGALIMVTHDRYFLDRITNRILEIDRGKLYTYKGNYSSFLEMKAERLDIESSNESKKQALLKKELAWIRKGAKARTTKQKARIERFEELSGDNTKVNMDKMEISSASTRLGKKVVEIYDIGKAFGSKILIKHFTYIILRDDRIGIIGPNGCGKTTLMNIIKGDTESDSGYIEKGETVKIGYYSQENAHLNDDERVIDYIREGAEYIETSDGSKISASQMLERFLFDPSMQWSFIGKLSGGEKRRLYLLRVLMDAPNVLLLDEPTNDLDIETLAILEDYLDGFQGAVLAVTHDRYFLDRIAEKVFAFEGEGHIVQYTGNYSDYHNMCKAAQKMNNEIPQKCSDKKKGKIEKEKALKFTYKEQKEFDEIDEIIENLEDKMKGMEEKINAGSSNYEILQKLLSEKELVKKELDQKIERWTYLNELYEKIEMSKKEN